MKNSPANEGFLHPAGSDREVVDPFAEIAVRRVPFKDLVETGLSSECDELPGLVPDDSHQRLQVGRAQSVQFRFPSLLRHRDTSRAEVEPARRGEWTVRRCCLGSLQTDGEMVNLSRPESREQGKNLMTSNRPRAVGISLLFLSAILTCLPAMAHPKLGSGVKGLSLPGLAGTPAGTPCEGLSNTSGFPDGIAKHTASKGGGGLIVQRFTPPNLPFRPTAICLPGFGYESSANYRVVFYSDVNGRPGARLASAPAATVAVGEIPGSWLSTNVDGIVPVLYGPFFAGVNPTTGTLAIGVDTNGDDPGQFVSGDGGETFEQIPGWAFLHNFRVAGVSGQDAVGIPTLSGLGLAALVAALAAGGALILRKMQG